jgi:hypothetical protein
MRRIEVLGAWLGLWTPPRGEVVPPVPWRAVGVVAVVLVAVIGGAAALMLPGIAADRQAARERDARAEARRHASFLAYVDREQRPRTGHGRLPAASAAIERDARRRSPKPVSGVECEPFPRTIGPVDRSRPRAAYDCVAVTARLPGGGIIGMSLRLVVDHERYAFCRIIPLGDRDRLAHMLPAACRLRANP